MERKLDRVIDKTLNYYEKNAQALSQRYESANVDEVQKLLSDTFPLYAHLLEIGCGSGRDASFLHEHGYSIVAIDGSKEMVKEAKLLHPELADSFEVRKVPEGLDFENESFDGVYSIATLMHFEKVDIDRTFAKAYDMLKGGGSFVFSVSIQRDDVNENSQDKNGRHFLTMGKDNWLDICYSKGFKLIKTIKNGDGLDRDGIIWLTCIVKK